MRFLVLRSNSILHVESGPFLFIFKSNLYLIELSLFSGCVEVGTETRQWTDMINNPRRPIANWHHLRPIPGTPVCYKYQHLHQSIV